MYEDTVNVHLIYRHYNREWEKNEYYSVSDNFCSIHFTILEN